MTQQSSTVGQVMAWLLARKPELQEIDMDTDLIENRIIDSLSFMNFVFFLEELTGQELQATARSVNSFRTLRAIQSDILQTKDEGGQVGV